MLRLSDGRRLLRLRWCVGTGHRGKKAERQARQEKGCAKPVRRVSAGVFRLAAFLSAGQMDRISDGGFCPAVATQRDDKPGGPIDNTVRR